MIYTIERANSTLEISNDEYGQTRITVIANDGTHKSIWLYTEEAEKLIKALTDLVHELKQAK